MLNVKYDFSSVHIDVPLSLSDDIIRWGKKEVTDEDIYATQKEPSFGREDEIHITILYGIHNSRPDQVAKLLRNNGPINVRLGKIGVFTNPLKYDVVMIEVDSPDLHKLYNLLDKGVAHSNRYNVYSPHVTIAYVKKGRAWDYYGIDKWVGTEFSMNHVIFSSKNGIKHQIDI